MQTGSSIKSGWSSVGWNLATGDKQRCALVRQQFPQTPRLIENDQHLTAFSSFLIQLYMLATKNIILLLVMLLLTEKLLQSSSTDAPFFWHYLHIQVNIGRLFSMKRYHSFGDSWQEESMTLFISEVSSPSKSFFWEDLQNNG